MKQEAYNRLCTHAKALSGAFCMCAGAYTCPAKGTYKKQDMKAKKGFAMYFPGKFIKIQQTF
jgi:hypothetical protein